MTIPLAAAPGGELVPQMGLGVWQVLDETECRNAVSWALESGYRHFDTAQAYDNEAFVGAALAEAGLARGELFVTTKIWNDNQYWDDLVPSLETSLKDLQTPYVDLLLLHFPVTELRRPAWRRMEQAQRAGLASAIGVSNYTIRHLEELLRECDVKPAVNQVELHVFLQQPELLAFCADHDILVQAYSPLAHGHGLGDRVLQSIAAKHGKSTAQVMIRWCVQRGLVPLPKSVRRERIVENADVFDFFLDDEDLHQILGLDSNYRTCWDPTNVP